MRLPRSVLLVAATALALSGLSSAARGDSHWRTTCSGGDIASGTYQTLRITGECTVPVGAEVIVVHNLVVEPGAQFIADTAPSTVHIGGNVRAYHGSFLGLGCTAAHGCEGGTTFSDTTVDGNVNLRYVFDAAINGVEVGGNVRSQGGGAGFVFEQGGFIPFSVKDDVIHGNLVVKGLKTTWFGVIRSQIDGNVILKYIKNDDPDGNEIVHDMIGGNLTCRGMSPAPQFGDADDDPTLPADYPYSTVGGRVSGQCRFVLNPNT
ncbi:hypothetical protein [Nocardioides sp.]|uniref:hypothetical protein n=1 Tax=Nocardioides sp. TaxID=35761 RepID=UPI002F3E74DC